MPSVPTSRPPKRIAAKVDPAGSVRYNWRPGLGDQQVSMFNIAIFFPSREDCQQARREMLEAEIAFKDYIDVHEFITQTPTSSDKLIQSSCEQYQKLLDEWTISKKLFEPLANHYNIYFEGYSLN
jgi:hypothetical protein